MWEWVPHGHGTASGPLVPRATAFVWGSVYVSRTQLHDKPGAGVAQGASVSPAAENDSAGGAGCCPSAAQSQDVSTAPGQEGGGRKLHSRPQNDEGIDETRASLENEEKTVVQGSESAALLSERKRLRASCIDPEEVRRWVVRYPQDMVHTLPRLPAAKRRRMRQQELRCYSSEERRKLTKVSGRNVNCLIGLYRRESVVVTCGTGTQW